jgi:hypothetical protein
VDEAAKVASRAFKARGGRDPVKHLMDLTVKMANLDLMELQVTQADNELQQTSF